jgi:hypothetical protein
LQPGSLRPQAVAELRAYMREGNLLSKVVAVSVYKRGVVISSSYADLQGTLRIYRIEANANLRHLVQAFSANSFFRHAYCIDFEDRRPVRKYRPQLPVR